MRTIPIVLMVLLLLGLFIRNRNGIRPLSIIRQTNNCDIRYRSDQKTHATSLNVLCIVVNGGEETERVIDQSIDRIDKNRCVK